jgi:hypothetical protein
MFKFFNDTKLGAGTFIDFDFLNSSDHWAASDKLCWLLVGIRPWLRRSPTVDLRFLGT